MAKEASEQKEPVAALNMRIPRKLRHRFKVWCVGRELEMTEVIVSHIKALLGDAPPADYSKKK